MAVDCYSPPGVYNSAIIIPDLFLSFMRLPARVFTAVSHTPVTVCKSALHHICLCCCLIYVEFANDCVHAGMNW